MAVLLSRSLWRSVALMRISEPLLLLALCSIEARFWDHTENSTQATVVGFHPRYEDMVILFDTLISRLSLMPSLEDVNLRTIQVILLYAQWMPCERGSINVENNSNQNLLRSRYNDVSAYAVLGLAMRFAKVMNLEAAATLPFQSPNGSASTDNVDRLRVWNNLVTCHYNLMLNSRFDASVDPTSAATASRNMMSHHAAQQLEDTRIAALAELSAIVYRAERSAGSLSRLSSDGVSLRKANSSFDDWEGLWRPRLIHTDAQHNSMPFTSCRWYRLALNSASLEPLLSYKKPADPEPTQLWRLQSLEISLTAAAQILLALSTIAPEVTWNVSSQDTAALRTGAFSADVAACKRLLYAVDSTWISMTFATAFLVLCYVRQAINGKLEPSPITGDFD